MAVDISKWTEKRIVARNRVEKAMAQSRTLATEIVAHFSEEVCESIATAEPGDIRGLVESQANVLKAKSLVDHKQDVANTFAMASIAEAASGEKSPQQIAAAVLASDSFDDLVAVVVMLDDGTIDRIDDIAAKLRLAVAQVKASRQSVPGTDTEPPAEEPAEQTPEAAPEPETRETEAAEVNEDEQTPPDAAP